MATKPPSDSTSTAAMFGRALRLACPRCGGRGVLRTWFKLNEHCPTCGLALERGETHDFWLGAYAINLVVTETLALLIAVAVLFAFWQTLPLPKWSASRLPLGFQSRFTLFRGCCGSRGIWRFDHRRETIVEYHSAEVM